MLGGTQGCSGMCTSVQKLVHKCSKMSCWLVAQAGWAPGRHLGGQGSGISFYSLGRKGKELMRAGGFTLFPLDGDGGIAERAGACLDAPAGSTHAHPWPLCVLQVGAVLAGCHSLVLLGADGVSLLWQMLQDCPKARREVELHWRASQCAHIVRIMDVYENLYQGRKCLLIVMEW